MVGAMLVNGYSTQDQQAYLKSAWLHGKAVAMVTLLSLLVSETVLLQSQKLTTKAGILYLAVQYQQDISPIFTNAYT